jgi:hypothetical protein
MPMTDEQLAARDPEELTPEQQQAALGLTQPDPSTVGWDGLGDYLRGAGSKLLSPGGLALGSVVSPGTALLLEARRHGV